MNPELQKQRGIVRGMVEQGRPREVIEQYLRTQGYESVDAWNAAVDSADQEQSRLAEIGSRRSLAGTRPGVDPEFESGATPAETAALGRGIMQMPTFGFGDELESAITGRPVDDIRRNMAENRQATMVGGIVGSGPMSAVSAGVLARMLPQSAGVMRTVGTAGALGTAEGAAYGAGGSIEGERLTGAKSGAALGGLLSFGIPATVAGGTGLFNAGRLLLGRQPFHAPTALYNAVEASPDYLASLSPLRGGTLADAMNRGPGGVQGTAITQAIGRGASPATARSIRQDVLYPRVEQAAKAAETTGTRMVQDYARARGLQGRPGFTGGPGQRTAWAEDVYRATEAVPVDDQNILRAINSVRQRGGEAFIDASRSGQNPDGPITWGEVRELERRLRLADQDPSAANRPPRRIREAYDELRAAMNESASDFGEAQHSYRAGINVAETMDDLARNTRNIFMGGELDSPRFASLSKTQIDDIESVFGELGRQRAVGLVNEMRNSQELMNVINQATRAAMRGGAKDEGLAETALTVAGYAGNNMYGAAFRTLVQKLLRGNEQTRRSAKQVLELLLGDSRAGIDALMDVPNVIERARQSSMRTSGLLGYVGGTTGGLLGGR